MNLFLFILFSFFSLIFSCAASTPSKNSSLSLPLNNNTKDCKLSSHKWGLMGGELSDHWAQELIGSDLLREELEKTPSPRISNWIAVFDSRQGEHNIHVKNLISDEGPHAVLPELEDEKIFFFQTILIEQYKNALFSLKTESSEDDVNKDKFPHFINSSMHWWESEDVYEVFQELSPPAIVVVSSGNGFPTRLEDVHSKASKNFDAILVGSFSPSGLVSHFSKSGEEVHIMAPSDDWITSAGEHGEYKKFGGTSGATPLVTGSLAAFKWLSGYRLTSKEAKFLLEKTAFPTLHSHEEPQVNGVGLLNAYKIGEVGKRLKKKCKNKRSFCFKREILNKDNYQFDLDINLKKDLNKAFPFCAIGENPITSLEESGCKEKEEVFKKLRKTILLNSKESKTFLKSLSCIYKDMGFLQNAKTLDMLALALGHREEVKAYIQTLAEKKDQIPDEVLRLILGMGRLEEKFNLLKNKKAIKMAGGIGAPAVPFLEKVFDIGNFDIQREALASAIHMGKSGLLILEKAFNTDNSSLQLEATAGAGQMGESGLSILKKSL